jgi:hypothetical protein
LQQLREEGKSDDASSEELSGRKVSDAQKLQQEEEVQLAQKASGQEEKESQLPCQEEDATRLQRLEAADTSGNLKDQEPEDAGEHLCQRQFFKQSPEADQQSEECTTRNQGVYVGAAATGTEGSQISGNFEHLQEAPVMVGLGSPQLHGTDDQLQIEKCTSQEAVGVAVDSVAEPVLQQQQVGADTQALAVDLESLSCKELVAACKEHGLATFGRKSELITRLLEFAKMQASAPASGAQLADGEAATAGGGLGTVEVLVVH